MSDDKGEQFLRTTEPRECPACWGNGYTAGDSETDKVPCGICAETGKVVPYTESPGGERAALYQAMMTLQHRCGYIINFCKDTKEMRLEAEEMLRVLKSMPLLEAPKELAKQPPGPKPPPRGPKEVG